MHDMRSTNPYIKRVQYLGEINRLKRITTFLRTVQTLCDLGSRERRWQRSDLARQHGADAEERAFIEDCRLRLQAIAAAKQYPEVYGDQLCQYIIAIAERAAQRRVPLVGDCNRIKDIAKLYHDGDLRDTTTALLVSYVSTAPPTPEQQSPSHASATGDQAVRGASDASGGKVGQAETTILITLTQRNALKLIGGATDIRKKIRAMLHTLPKVADKADETRKKYLDVLVRTAIEKTTITGWQCNYIELRAGDYAIYSDGSLSPLDSLFPSASESHGGFYEHAFLWMAIQDLNEEQQQALGKFLRSKDFNGDLALAVNRADPEDIYRVLTYLKRLKK